MVFGSKPALMRHPGNYREDAHADDHVNRVHARQGEVERKEELRMLLDIRFPLSQLHWIGNFVQPQEVPVAWFFHQVMGIETQARNVVLFILVVPLVALYSQEDQTE